MPFTFQTIENQISFKYKQKLILEDIWPKNVGHLDQNNPRTVQFEEFICSK